MAHICAVCHFMVHRPKIWNLVIAAGLGSGGGAAANAA